MNNIETGYKCKLIKKWSFERKLKGKTYKFNIVYDISRKIERDWELTEKQHKAIDNIYRKFRIKEWAKTKKLNRDGDSCSDSSDCDILSDSDTCSDSDTPIFTHKRDMRDMYCNPNTRIS